MQDPTRALGLYCARDPPPPPRMRRLSTRSLTIQLPLVATGGALLVGLCVLWLAMTSSTYLNREQERAYGEALARQIAISVRDPLQSSDLLAARAALQRFIDAALAAGITVSDVEGTVMGSAGDLNALDTRRYRARILIGDDVAGAVSVAVDQRASRGSRGRFLFSLLALVAALGVAVYLGTRVLAQRLSLRLLALDSQLALPAEAREEPARNELRRLEESVALLPLDMLRGHAPLPAAATDYRQSALLFIHLASLVGYVDTLSERSLHRYTRRLQQIVQAAAQCYRGEVSVSRPFGLLVRFQRQPNAGSEALRAACCARLLTRVTRGLGERTSLSLNIAAALGFCEEGPDGADDIYPKLYQQGAIDELREACLAQRELPAVLLAPGTLEDPQLGDTAALSGEGTARAAYRSLLALSDEQEMLLTYQAELIVERIQPRGDKAPRPQPDTSMRSTR